MEIFLLMFADDIAFIADTIVGLQKQLNILQGFCELSKLTVNIAKSKVLVFKRGGRVANNEKLKYNGSALEIVQGFIYVGIYFTNRLSFYRMAESTAIKAKKALVSMFNSLHRFSCLPYKTFFKLFDSKISSMFFMDLKYGVLNLCLVLKVFMYMHVSAV